MNAWPGGGTLRSKSGDMNTYLNAALLQSPNADINAAMKQAEKMTTLVSVNNNGTDDQHLAWVTDPINGETVTYKDGVTGGFTAWIGLVNPGTVDGVGIVVMTNLGEQGTTEPAAAIAKKILNDVGP